MSSLTQRHCHSHRAEHPYGQGGNSNYLEERGDRGMVSQCHIHRSEYMKKREQKDNMHPVGFPSLYECAVILYNGRETNRKVVICVFFFFVLF